MIIGKELLSLYSIYCT